MATKVKTFLQMSNCISSILRGQRLVCKRCCLYSTNPKPSSGEHLKPPSGEHVKPPGGEYLRPPGGEHLKPPSGEHLKPPGGVKTYIVKKYVGYIEGFEIKVEKHYPKFYQVYRLFKDGIVEFFNDTKLYSVVASRIWAGEELGTFTWKELETYRQMPSDFLRSAPVLIAAPLPAVPYFFYPVCYMFPRQLLCQHFWTPQQKIEFGVYYLRQRLPFYPKILHSLERHSIDIKDTSLRRMFQDVLLKLENESHPSVEELLEIKDLFKGKPFSIKAAPRLQMYHVARSWNLSTLRHSRFMNDAILLHNIDLAMCREGVDSLSTEAIQQSCFTRGLNPENICEPELKEFLTMWTDLSGNIDEASLSLLLHAPVLLTYNRPSNKRYLLSNVDVQENPP